MSVIEKKDVFWLGRQMRPFWAGQSVAILLVIVGGLMFLLDPLLMKWLIDTALPRKDMRLLSVISSAFLVIYLCRLGAGALSRVVTFRTIQRLAFQIRLDMFRKMNSLSADYHLNTSPGDKLYRMEQDVDQVAELGSSIISSVLQTAVNTMFVVATMSVLNLRLTCILTPLLPIFFFSRKYFEFRLRRSSDSAQRRASDESSFLQEHLGHILQVHLLNQQQHQEASFVEKMRAKVMSLNQRAIVEAIFATCYMGVISVGAMGILAYGGYEVFVGALTIGGLVAFYSYLIRLFEPLNVAVDVYSRITRLGASLHRIGEVMHQVPSVTESPTAILLPDVVDGRVELRNVDFGYGEESRILTACDLIVASGEKVAVVGSSGSGKSSLTKLIVRLYDPKRGGVFVDGLDVRDINLQSLRSHICLLMQDAILFDRTLKENLLLGNPSATEDELIRAIEITGLRTVLRRLQKGWDTPLGPRGISLSGGERQRVALARAVLQNPSVLILDESTSALDAPSERRIFCSLNQYFSRQTMIVISHRITALSWVDRLVVVAGGAIREQGTHDQLLRQRGIYKHLYEVSANGNLSFPALRPGDLSEPALPDLE
jgi:ABC-type bacteriocin/lantibiotic exporter with double-glycine peptidase domain